MLSKALVKRTPSTNAYHVLVTVTSLFVGLALFAANLIRVEVSRRHLLDISGGGYVYEWDEYRYRKYEWGWPAVFLTRIQHERKVMREADPDLPGLIWMPIPGGWEQAVQSYLDADNLLLDLLFSLVMLVCTVWLVAKYGHAVVTVRLSLKAVWLLMSLLCVMLSLAAFEYSMGPGTWWLTALELDSHPVSAYRMYVSLTWRPLYVRIPVLFGCFCVIAAGVYFSATLIGKIVRGLTRR